MTQSLAEQLALWADKLRDISATGLAYASTLYDQHRYQAIQTIAMEMFATATAQEQTMLEPLRATVFQHISPFVAGTAAVIDQQAQILLMQRADNQRWVMPGGIAEVGETPAQGVVRETLEETGVVCIPVALVGVYDSRIWDTNRVHHLYKLTFLCQPDTTQAWAWPPSHAIETLEIGWFVEEQLPKGLYEGHRQRIKDAFGIWRGEQQPHFDL